MDRKLTEELLEFIEKSPSCYHVIANLKNMLMEAGFEELREETEWKLQYGGRYYVTRNGSTVMAFQVPKESFDGFLMAASHSDFPSFKIKENPEILVDKKYTCLNVEKYGGMIYAPWLDRPLSIAGRIVIREDGKIATRLVNIPRDLVLIPNLAIHMEPKVNEKLTYNPQEHLLPIFGDETAKEGFKEFIAKEAKVDAEDILSTDLFLYPRTKGSIWGAKGEFVSSRALDDLQCAFSTMKGFLEAENENRISMCCVFDNEEVGSGTKQGADSTMLAEVIDRIGMCFGKSKEQMYAAIANSFLVSADNGHAVHPNYAKKADPTNRPYPNHGVVIKYNANQKYTTDAVSAGIFKEICKRAEVPVQSYVNRSDVLGGFTLGNIANRHVSLNTIDIGVAQLAMHSTFETGGTKDTRYLIQACKAFFETTIRAKENGVYEID